MKTPAPANPRALRTVEAGRISTTRPTIGILVRDFELGGTERVALRLACAWSQLGYRTILFCGAPAGPQKHLVADGLEVVVATPAIPATSVGATFALGRWISGRIAALGVDVLYLPGNSYFGCVSPAARAGTRVYVTVTNALWRADRSWFRNVFFTALTRWRLRKAHGVASMAPSLLREESGVHGPRAASGVLPNAIFTGNHEPEEVERRRWQLCAVGRLVPQKNFALLLHTVALLQDLPVTLSIAGDGPQRVELQRLARSLGIAERVEFLGAVPDAARCIATAEVLVLTSGYEGYPAVVVEAVALGTFVVASRCSSGIGDILRSPAAGTTVPVQRAAAFATVIRQFFAGPARLEYRSRRRAGAHLAQWHDSMNAAQEYLRFMGLEGRPAVTDLAASRQAVTRAQAATPCCPRAELHEPRIHAQR